MAPPATFRRILNPFSDSDSEIESHKLQSPEPSSKVTSPLKNNTPVIHRNGTINRQKNPGVLEKEKQMKFLLEIFPNLEAMVFDFDRTIWLIPSV